VVVSLLIVGIEIGINFVPLDVLVRGVLGALVGLILAQGLSQVVLQEHSSIIHFILAYLGLAIFAGRRLVTGKGSKKKASTVFLLDESILIDGRVADLCEGKFVGGVLVVPRFVFQQLQQRIASTDSFLQARGRRGLETLSCLQKNSEVIVKIVHKDFPEIKETDMKLAALARELGAKILTADFNLNKIAGLQNVTVLNVHDLFNVLKPVVLPGDTMDLFVVKEGKDRDQGLAYLDDGAVAVVEGGRRFIGHKTKVTITSLLRTPTGRTIFARAGREKVELAPASPPVEESLSAV
jgi:uncharacterized protein YacL